MLAVILLGKTWHLQGRRAEPAQWACHDLWRGITESHEAYTICDILATRLAIPPSEVITSVIPREDTSGGWQTVWQCGLCPRNVDDPSNLTAMRKSGVIEPLRICNQPDCWERAKAQGYESESRA